MLPNGDFVDLFALSVSPWSRQFGRLAMSIDAEGTFAGSSRLPKSKLPPTPRTSLAHSPYSAATLRPPQPPPSQESLGPPRVASSSRVPSRP
jgi:hypothetical protein